MGCPLRKKCVFVFCFLIFSRSFDHYAEGGGAKGLSGLSTKKYFFLLLPLLVVENFYSRAHAMI